MAMRSEARTAIPTIDGCRGLPIRQAALEDQPRLPTGAAAWIIGEGK
jgi:hypothetical protein